MNLSPITLSGQYVRLVPLEYDHVSELTKIGSSPEIWKFMRYGYIDTEEKMWEWVDALLKLQAAGSDLPFTVIHPAF